MMTSIYFSESASGQMVNNTYSELFSVKTPDIC